MVTSSPSSRDWPPLGVDDNDGYTNTCVECGETFVGHKHHWVCRLCHDEAAARWDALTPEQRDAETARVAEELRAFMELRIPDSRQS